MIIREIKELIFYHLKYERHFAEHDYYNVYKKAIRDLQSVRFSSIKKKRILDLGCGQRYPFALLCAASGAIVTAVDINYVKPDALPLAFFQTIKHNGFKRGFKSLMRRLFFDSLYYKTLEISYGKSLNQYVSQISFVIADPLAKSYPLPSDSFDLIISNAVIEHVENVSRFAQEIYRLLSNRGYFYGIIHNFYSLSGGHNLEWAYPDDCPSNKVPPWDHLRENRYPSSVLLNRLLPEEYQNEFAEHLEILLFEGRDINHEPKGHEGEQFLTSQLEAELDAYQRELLLTRSWCIICQKK